MNQNITEKHEVNAEGNPAGGASVGTGIEIRWQNGPMKEQGGAALSQNGAFVEGVINAAIGRIKFYQDSKFRCRENALALTKLEEAVMWLNKRTADREAQGIEGTHRLRESEG